MNCVTTGWQNAGFFSFNQYELTDTHNSQVCMQTWPADGVSKDILCQIKIPGESFFCTMLEPFGTMYNVGIIFVHLMLI